jgi:hypothetical protein
MKNFSLILKIAIIVFIFQSCVVGKKTSENMESWKGSHISDVIASWGPETKITGDGKGGEIYTWENRWQTNAYYGYNGVYQPPTNRSCVKSFYINEKKIIYSWRWQGSCR